MDSPHADPAWQQTGWERGALLSSSPASPRDYGAGICDTWSPWRLWFMVDFQKGHPLTLAACHLTIFSLGWEDSASGSMSIPSLSPGQSFWETLWLKWSRKAWNRAFSWFISILGALCRQMWENPGQKFSMSWNSDRHLKRVCIIPKSI